MKTINQNEFKHEVREFKGVALIDFYGEECDPCKVLSPLLDEMSKANADPNVKFLKMNVETERAIAEMLGIVSIPTVVVFKDGRLVTQKIGVSPKVDYLKAIERAKTFDANANRKVIVFSTPTCPFCHQAKAYLKEKGVAFEDVDVSKDQQKAQQMVERSGQTGVPQLWIDDLVVVGFNRPQINMMLGIR
jgi:thioredoxin